MSKRLKRSLIFFFILTLLMSLHNHLKSKFPVEQKLEIRSFLEELPLHFIENQGQEDASVKYHLKISQGDIYFSPSEIVYQYINKKGNSMIDSMQRQNRWKPTGEIFVENVISRFEGANEGVKVIGLDPTEAKFNYLRGNDHRMWITNIQSYSRILYQELYPHVNLVVYGDKGKIKLEYHLKPGADPESLKIKYEGIQALTINEKGQLEMRTGNGTLREDAPTSFQLIEGEKIQIDTEYVIEDRNIVRFNVKGYEKDTDLIIDPELDYSTFLGKGKEDQSFEMAVDDEGNTYITGKTESPRFPTTKRAYDRSYNGKDDIFVSKINPTGSKLFYSTFVGGSEGDYGLGMAIDSSGNAFVTGLTWSTDFPTTQGAFDQSHNGKWDAFIFKIDSNGSNLLYSTFLGGIDDDIGYEIAVHKSGNAYVIGETDSAGFPTTKRAYDRTINGQDDIFVTKVDPAGKKLLYSTFVGGTWDDRGYFIEVDKKGDAYTTGQTWSYDFPTTPGAFDRNDNGGGEIFVTKLNAKGSKLIYSTYLGGSGEDFGEGIRYDEKGNVFVSGDTESSDFPTTRGAYDTSYNGNQDIFVAKLNSKGKKLLYSTYLGGNNWDEGDGIVINEEGYAFVTGHTNSNDFPTTQDALDLTQNGGIDVFISELDPAGKSLVYSTFMGGKSDDTSESLVYKKCGYIYITGYSESKDFPTTPGVLDRKHNGGDNVFIAKLSMSSSIYSVSGHVTDKDTEKPVKKAKVKITGISNKKIKKTTLTDSNGNYEFSCLEAGTYKFTVTKKGYMSYTNKKVSIVDGDVVLDIELKKK